MYVPDVFILKEDDAEAFYETLQDKLNKTPILSEILLLGDPNENWKHTHTHSNFEFNNYR